MSKELIEALKKAEKIEKIRSATYKDFYKKVNYPAGKKVLLFLVKAEKTHLEFLKEQEKNVEGNEAISLDIESDDINLELSQKTKINLEGLEGDINILREAAKLEKEDVKFYENARNNIKDERSKELFKKMALLEKNHLKLINEVITKAEKESLLLQKSKEPIYLFPERAPQTITSS